MTFKIKNLLILVLNVNVSRLPYAMNYTMIVDDLSFVRPQPALYGTENATMRFGEILLEDPRARCDVVYVCPIIERKNR